MQKFYMKYCAVEVGKFIVDLNKRKDFMFQTKSHILKQLN